MTPSSFSAYFLFIQSINVYQDKRSTTTVHSKGSSCFQRPLT